MEQFRFEKIELLYPEFNMLYRGAIRLGVLLYVKGIKIYYFDFVKNKRFAIFEKALFNGNDVVRLGKFRLNDITELVNLMKNESLSSPTFTPCRSICSGSSTSISSLRSIYSDIESQSNGQFIQYATEKLRIEIQDAVSKIDDNINSKLADISAIITNQASELKSLKQTIASSSIPEVIGEATTSQNNNSTVPQTSAYTGTDRKRINQYHSEGKAYTGRPLRTRGSKEKGQKQLNPNKPLVLQPYKGRTAILRREDFASFKKHYQGKSGADILDAELRYIASNPASRPLLLKIEPYVTGSPCLVDTMPRSDFVKVVFEMLLESQLVRPY